MFQGETYLLLLFGPLLGGAIGFWLKNKAGRFVRLFLSFSGAFLFSIVAMHLLPEVFRENDKAGLFVLLGFFIQVVLELLSHGVEHGHFHMHRHSAGYVFSLLFGLSLHSVMDGMPLTHALVGSTTPSLLYGIVLHKIPEGFALSTVMLYSGYRAGRTAGLLLLFSLIAPASVFLLDYFQVPTDSLHILLAIAAGSFIHVSTTILFESDKGGHHLTWQKLTAILAGVGLSLLSL